MTGIVRLLAAVTLFGSVLGPVLAAPACFTPPEQIGLYAGVLASSVIGVMLAMTCALIADIADHVRNFGKK